MANFIFLLITLLSTVQQTIIFNFNTKSKLKNWYVIDDTVMGGRSSGEFSLNKEGHGVFQGTVSTENNGGFSSLRYRSGSIAVREAKKAVIRLKGDGKTYQFRIKDSRESYHSYIFNFKTTGKWEEIKIPLNEMYPSFRGRRLRIDNFSSSEIQEVGFLIGNKTNEKFKLMIDRIYLM